MAFGTISTALMSAGIVGQLLASWLTSSYGWPSFFLVTGALLLLLGAGAAWRLTEPRLSDDRGGGPEPSFVGRLRIFAALVRQRPVAMANLAHIGTLLTFVAMYTALGRQVAQFGLGESDLQLIRLIALPAMLTTLLSGPLIARRGLRATLRAAYSVATLGLGLQLLFPRHVVVMTVASVIFVAGISLLIPSMISLFAELARASPASGMASSGFFLFLGASLVPVIGTLDIPYPGLLAGLIGALLMAMLLAASAARTAAAGEAGR